MREGPNKRISNRLAVVCVAITFTLGLIFGLTQLALDFSVENKQTEERIDRILNATEKNAINAALRLDEEQANEIVKGLMVYDFILQVEIADEKGQVLASSNRVAGKSNTRWLTKNLAHLSEVDSVSTESRILRSPFDPERKVGNLSVKIDFDKAFSGFYERSKFVLISGLVRNIVLGLILIGVFYIFVTKGLVQILRFMNDRDLPSLVYRRIEAPRGHEEDELGELVDSTNKFLGAISDHQEKQAAAEAALRMGEDRFKDFTISTADRFWETGLDHRFVYFSGPSGDLNFPVDYLLGRTQWDVVGNIPVTDWDELKDLMDARKPFRDFRYIATETGVGYPVHVRISGTPVFDKNGSFTGYRGTSSDETAEVEARELAQASQKKFVEAMENISVGYVLWSEDDRLISFNENFAMINESIKDILEPGLKYEDYIRARAVVVNHDSDENEEEWIKAHLGKYAVDDCEFETAIGEKLYRIRRHRLSDGTLVALLFDITDEKMKEELLRQSQKMEAVGQLTGGVAHDFNNILTGILGNLELLSGRLEDREKALERIDRSIQLVKRGSSLTHRLLAFSRQQSLEPEQTNVAELVGGMLDLLKRTLGESINIEIENEPELWTVSVDQHQMENAILNLSINARDAMMLGGNLKISCRNLHLLEAEPLLSDTVSPGDYLVVSVEDTGTGIAADTMEKVFEPFFTTKEFGRGSGLGLSMAHGFVRQSGGHINMESELGIGTKVSIYLPSKGGGTIELIEREASTHVYTGAGQKVLVIEDDSDVREITTASLEKLGYQVIDGDDGSGVMDISDDNLQNVDLLLSDVVLPGGMNGADIAARLKEKNQDLKVLLITGYADQNILHSAMSEKQFDLLQKPFEFHELARKVNEILSGDPA